MGGDPFFGHRPDVCKTAWILRSYASWVLFDVGAAEFLDRPGDDRKLGAGVLSAAGGELQHLFGFGRSIGTRWPDFPSPS